MKKTLRLAAFLAPSLVAAVAWADLSYTEKLTEDTIHLMTGQHDKAPAESKVLIKGDKVKYLAKDHVFIFRPDLKVWWDIYPDKKLYYETTFAASDARGEKAVELLPKLEQEFAPLPEQRKKAFEIWKYRVQEHMGKTQPPQDPSELQEPAEDQEIGGAKCQHKVVLWSTQTLFDAWMDPGLEGFGALVKMWETNRAFSPYVLARLKALAGFPRKGKFTVLWLNADLVNVTFEYTDFKKDALPDAEFDLPAGLTKAK